MRLTAKQETALEFLEDEETTELLFGGAAGSGKTLFGCVWLISMCTVFAGTRWLMGRAKLKALKGTTLKTFFEACVMLGIHPEHWNYNAQESVITWANGSEIVLKDLFAYPSDPDFVSLGGLELTGGFIDEAPEITLKARDIVKSRIRFKLDDFLRTGEATKDLKPTGWDQETGLANEWLSKITGRKQGGLIPKLFMSCNPNKGWSYVEFYKANRDNKIVDFRKFIQALPSDNPHLSKEYLKTLDQLNRIDRARLLLGEWEFDNDPARLMEFDAISDIFTNEFVEGGRACLTVDVARFGNDRSVCIYWNGLRAEKIWSWEKQGIDVTITKVDEIARQYKVRKSRVVVDSDGLGSGLADVGKYKGFVNNARPLKVKGKQPNFDNLKSQCYFKLAELINAGSVFVDCPETMHEGISEELEQVKAKSTDRDNKMGVVPKDQVSKLLGRSPDVSDALMMRIYFELKPGMKSAGL